MRISDRWTAHLTLVLLLALGVRLCLAVGVQSVVDRSPNRVCLIAGDADGYWSLAQKIVRGEEFALYDPPRYVLRMPGFPGLLAASVWMFGESLWAARILLAGIGAVACGLVYWLGCLLGDRRTGLWAGLLAALSPAAAGFSVLMLSETLFAVGLLLSLIALAKISQLPNGDNPNRGRGEALLAVAAGVAVGLATLVRPTWILVGPVFAVLYVFQQRIRRPALVRSGWLLLGLAMTLLPWTARNYFVTGHIVPTTLWVGASLYDGLNPQATGRSDMRFIEEDGVYRRLSEYEADQHYRRLALEFVRQNPVRVLKLAAVKLTRFWSPVPSAEEVNHIGVRLIFLAFSLPVGVFAAIGLWQVRRCFWTVTLLLAPVLYFAAVHAVFVGSMRYRLPAEYPLYVLAAIGAVWMFDRLAARRGAQRAD